MVRYTWVCNPDIRLSDLIVVKGYGKHARLYTYIARNTHLFTPLPRGEGFGMYGHHGVALNAPAGGLGSGYGYVAV